MTPLELIIALCDHLKVHPDQHNTPILVLDTNNIGIFIDDIQNNKGYPIMRTSEVRD